MQGGLALVKDFGAYFNSAMCGAVMATAAGAGDATEVDGQSIDLTTLGYPKSAKLVISYKTTLAASKTLALAHNLQQYNGSTWADFGTVTASTVVATDSGSGSTLYGTVEVDYDLSLLDYNTIRAQFTPDLNASGTDTAIISAVLLFGGQAELPL